MSGSDSDDTYCSEIITDYHIMGRRKKEAEQKNFNSVVRRSTRIPKKKNNLTSNKKIKMKNDESRIVKPKINNYIDILKETLSRWNYVVYKHISKKNIITQGEAENFLNDLNKMKSKYHNKFDEETYQVWEKLTRQFKSITCNEQSSYDSYESSLSHKKSINVSEIININGNQSSLHLPTPHIQNYNCKSISSAQKTDDSTSCAKIISSSRDIDSACIIAEKGKKKSKHPRNLEKNKCMIRKKTPNKCNSDSVSPITVHQSSQSSTDIEDHLTVYKTVVPNNILSERVEKYNKNELTPSIAITDTSIQSKTFLQSQSILLGYKENIITDNITNTENIKTDSKIGKRSYSENPSNIESENDATMPQKTVIKNFEQYNVKTKDDTVEKSSKMQVISPCSDDVEIVHYSFPESESILVDKDRERSHIISPSYDLNTKNILMKNLPESININFKGKKSTLTETHLKNFLKNCSMGNVQNDDMFLSSQEIYDEAEIIITPKVKEVNLQLDSCPSIHKVADSPRNNSEILVKKLISGEKTESTIYKKRDKEIANMETENIFNSMNESYLNNALSSPVENSQMSTHLLNNFRTNIKMSHSDQHQVRVRNETIQSLSLPKTSKDNIYSWLKNIDKCRKIEENELILKDTLPSFYLQASLTSVPLELENEFIW